jgi:hypothetical protein
VAARIRWSLVERSWVVCNIQHRQWIRTLVSHCIEHGITLVALVAAGIAPVRCRIGPGDIRMVGIEKHYRKIVCRC